MLPLSVDVHEPPADLAEQGRADGPPVDPRNRPPTGAHLACQHQPARLVSFQAMLGQQGRDPGRSGRVEPECPLDLRALGPGAHDILRRPVAQQQADGVDDDGLAGACLAGQHVEAGSEGQIQVLDDGEITNAQFCQHGSSHLQPAHRLARQEE